ncbi:MAG: hypothetical protein C0508_10600 [Cyanobacteria bacterium PR.023]|jgi:alpha-beta hydrolase superfamily lysophospholipase|nr:hypothetical protein [Cyanobacteria bacterium PR.023]
MMTRSNRQLCFGIKNLKKTFGAAAAAFFSTLISLQSLPALAQCQVERDDAPLEHGMTNLPDIPVSVWRKKGVKPQAVAIAVHGMVMHGGVYDRLASELVGLDFEVYAQDLRGYGRWQFAPTAKSTLSYKESLEDLKALVRAARNEHPDLPVFLIGESMGAGLSLRAAAAMPGEISGLVLSSPALKRRNYCEPEMVKDVAALFANPVRQFDMVPYIRKFASEDPQIAQETIEDPMVRKTLSLRELLKTASVIRTNINHVKNIPADMPVLVMQGDHDRMLQQNAVVTLLKKLKSTDQTVRWLPGKGHVLIETAHIDPTTLFMVKSWLVGHLPSGAERVARVSTKAKYHDSDLVELSSIGNY